MTPDSIRQIEKNSAGQPYPVLVQHLKQADIAGYEVIVTTLAKRYIDNRGQLLHIQGETNIACADYFDIEAVIKAVKRTQQGLTDYPAFLAEIAAAGVHKYFADLLNMKINYMGKDEEVDHYIEEIPTI